MQSSQNSYNIENYSSGPEPFFIEQFKSRKSVADQAYEDERARKKAATETPEWKAARAAAVAADAAKRAPAANNAQYCVLTNKPVKPQTPDYLNKDTQPAFDTKNLKYKDDIAKWNVLCTNDKITLPASDYWNNLGKSSNFTDYSEGMNVEEGFGNYEERMTVEQMADLASVQMSNEVSPQWSARANQQTQNSPMMSSQGQGPAGSFNGNSSFQPVSNMGGMGGGAGGSNQQGMQSCFPRDRLSADDLLPKDAADSKWAQINPSGGGNIGDQNYLTAGYHVGVNTVGQSLRNANLQLRSEIPNPQDAVGPWMISTIEPDLRQNTLEIGSSISY